MSYLPPGILSLKDAHTPQFRIGLMGFPFTGKTWSALTFPGPVVCNFDNKLGAHTGRDVLVVPFHEPKFVDALAKRTASHCLPNVRDAFTMWLKTEGMKLQSDQTLIVDSWTMLNQRQEQQEGYEPCFTAQNKIDDRAPWRHKIDYFNEVTQLLSQLSCNVVVTFHEQDERHKAGPNAGELTGKIRPLMSGQFKDHIGKHLTDMFRQHAFAKTASVDTFTLKPYLETANKEYLRELYESTPANVPTVYAWQTYSDNMADCGSCLKNPPPFIPANYEAYRKYQISLT